MRGTCSTGQQGAARVGLVTSALAGLEAFLVLVDHVDAALAPDDLALLMPALE